MQIRQIRPRSDRNLPPRVLTCVVLGAAALSMALADGAAARGGGGGGGGRGGGGGGQMAQGSVAAANRSAGGATLADRSGSRSNISTGDINTGNRNNINNGNINVGNDINIDIDGGYGNRPHVSHPIAPSHPVGAAVAVGAIAATTAAVAGSYYYSLPPGCTTVTINGVSYNECGTVYYQQRWEGNDVVYVAVSL
jgi:hypothetical protein